MIRPTAVILESTVAEDCPKPEQDELRENSKEIGAALSALGYRVEIVAFTLDTHAVRQALLRAKPDVVFNLVDSIEGKGDLIAMAPMLLAHMGLAYTGADARSTAVTCDKLLTKRLLRAESIPTGDWLCEAQIEALEARPGIPYILKSVTEHASFGIYADSIVTGGHTLRERFAEKKSRYGGEWFAEAYIEGREFNLSVLAQGESAMVLPPAEILFTSDFPADKPRIVDYAAKWHTDSAESIGTVRSFHFHMEDQSLLATLTHTALACWRVFGLNGYARVDYRVDATGRPYVLEVNCNPFLTAAEGFGAAAAHQGLAFSAVLRAILADAYRRNRQSPPEMPTP